MRHSKAAALLLVLASSQSAFASVPCKAVAWPFAIEKDTKVLRASLAAMDRQSVQSYYFHGLTHSGSEGLTEKLGLYLINTEQNKRLRSMYKLFQAAKKPEPPGSPSKVLSLDEVCSIYSKTLKLK